MVAASYKPYHQSESFSPNGSYLLELSSSAVLAKVVAESIW
jgi:hypothetical protein